MLQGLQRLIQNGWKLSVSADSQDIVDEQQEQANSLIGFMKSELSFGPSYIYALMNIIEDKDLSVSIGDDVIGRSYDRYSRSRGVRVNSGAFANAY